MGKDLLSLAVLSDADMRQHLFLKDLPGVQDALVAEHALRRAALADVVERDGAILDYESLLERGAHHLHQLRVRKVVHDMLEYVAVSDEAERAEDDHYRHFLPNVWQRAVDGRAIDTLHRVAGKQPHVHRRGGARGIEARLELGHVRVLGGLLLREDVYGVVGHLLLCYQHLLRAIYHKVAALVVWALAQVGQLAVV